MPKANSTNEVVFVDLKERRDFKKEILYMCDEFSGFLVAEVIDNKLPESVMKAFNKRFAKVLEFPAREFLQIMVGNSRTQR